MARSHYVLILLFTLACNPVKTDPEIQLAGTDTDSPEVVVDRSTDSVLLAVKASPEGKITDVPMAHKPNRQESSITEKIEYKSSPIAETETTDTKEEISPIEKASMDKADTEVTRLEKETMKMSKGKEKDSAERDITGVPVSSVKADHSLWDQMLKKYVSPEGRVDYASWKKEVVKLKAYLKELSAHMPDDSWTREEKMAYWINAYNAHTIDLIISHYPIASILDLDGGKTWEVKRISLGGKLYSLNEIEHDILRPVYQDPRVHFAVNCAAISCPKLRNSAWSASSLDKDLEAATLAFINHAQFNTITPLKLGLSKIFEWYREDFGNLVDFINRYSAIKAESGARIQFLDYNWKLNGR